MNNRGQSALAVSLRAKTRSAVEAEIAGMSPEDRKHLSAAWLSLLQNAAEIDPWVLGFEILDASGAVVGCCGFKGPPDENGTVEIAYGVKPELRGKGYATAAASELVNFAFRDQSVRVVCAHTLEQENASAAVLRKCGFTKVGQVNDAEDGLVWRWKKTREESAPG